MADLQLNDGRIQKKLGSLAQAGANLRPVMAAISEQLKSITEYAFRREANPATGAPWKELSPVTLARRTRGGTRKLIDSGDLLRSITADHSSRAALVGTNLDYAPVHQFGGTKGQRGGSLRNSPILTADIPARPFLGYNAGDQRDILKIVNDHLRKVIARD